MKPEALLAAVFLMMTCFLSAEISWVDENQKIIRQIKAGESSKAIEAGSLLMKKIRTEFVKNQKVSADAVVFLVNHGLICKQNRQYPAARESLLLAAECKIKIAPQNDPLFVTIYKALGEVFQALAIFDEGESCFLKALKIKEINLGLEHPDTLPLYFSIADFYQAASKEREGLEYLQKALTISKSKNGRESPKTADVYFNLGEYYYKFKRNQEAELAFLNAFSIYDRSKEYRKIADVYDYLGSLNKLKGNVDEAESYYRLSLKSREKTAGKNSFDYAKSLNNLASIYLMRNNPETENLLKQALDICERNKGGRQQASLAVVLSNLIDYYSQNKNTAEAEKYKAYLSSIQHE